MLPPAMMAGTTNDGPQEDTCCASYSNNAQSNVLLASSLGHVKCLRKIMATWPGTDVNVFSYRTVHSPLTYACRYGFLDVAEYLVKHCGANVNLNTVEHNSSPLCWAAEFGHLMICKFLINEGADFNVVSCCM